jgi:hypothetical protein
MVTVSAQKKTFPTQRLEEGVGGNQDFDFM